MFSTQGRNDPTRIVTLHDTIFLRLDVVSVTRYSASTLHSFLAFASRCIYVFPPPLF